MTSPWLHRMGLFLALVCLLAGPRVNAGDPEAGRVKAESCLMCHGPAAFQERDEQAVAELIRELFESDRPHPPAQLSEEDLADIAAFYARGE